MTRKHWRYSASHAYSRCRVWKILPLSHVPNSLHGHFNSPSSTGTITVAADDDVNCQWFAIKINWPTTPNALLLIHLLLFVKPFNKPQSFAPIILNLFNLIICYGTSVVVGASTLLCTFFCVNHSLFLYRTNSTWSDLVGKHLLRKGEIEFSLFYYHLVDACRSSNKPH